ncbi:MAG: exonuclease domain-containing protein [Nocardioidaceae bacterium]
MSWADGPILGFDTETTGVDVHTDRIVTACTVMVRPPGHGRPAAHTWLIDPGIDIPDGAAAIHGITTSHAQTHGADPNIALFEISARIAVALSAGIPVVIFNAAYDLSILEAENVRHRLPTLTERMNPRRVGPIVDPFVLDRHLDPRRKGKRTLAATCDHYHVTLPAAHTADADALAAARLARVIGVKYPQIARLRPGDLHASQIAWHSDRQASFATWLKSQGRDATDVDGHWPIRRQRVMS